MSQRFRQICAGLAAIFGVQCWLVVMRDDWGRNAHVALLLLAVMAAAVPPVRKVIWNILRKTRRLSPQNRAITAVVAALIAGIVLARFAFTSGRDLFPTMHDEFQFLLQARMLSEGHLWMRPLPLPDFFDTFYVLVTPKYAAQSFPGAAIFYVPAMWFNISPWKISIVIAAATVGLFYRVVAELIDGLAGIVAAAMLTALPLFRFVSTMVLAQLVILLLGLAICWTWLRWRKAAPRRRVIWALVIGILSGWAAITRPADALLFALPVAIAFLPLHVLRERAGVRVLRRAARHPLIEKNPHPNPLPEYMERGQIARTLAAAVLGALPFITLQLVFDQGVTGHLLKTPFSLYNDRDQPQLSFGLFPPSDNRLPLTKVPEKRDYYQTSVMPRIREHRPGLFWRSFIEERLPVTLAYALPQPMLAALLPLGLLMFFRRRYWLLAAGLPLFFILYTPYPIFATHYPVVAAPGAIVLTLLAPIVIGRAWPKARRGVWIAMTVFAVGLLFTPMVDVQPMVGAMAFHSRVLQAANQWLSQLDHTPAVVLFARDSHVSDEEEPVYNLDAGWPDEQRVIRVHDLGAENWKLFRYYAAHGPDRAIYRFDESTPEKPPTFLGMASDLNNEGIR